MTGYKAIANAELTIGLSSGVATISASGASSLSDLFGSGTNLKVGSWIKLNEFLASSSNVWARITGANGTTITFDAPSGLAADAATGKRGEIFFGDYVVNGTDAATLHMFAMEKRFADHSPVTREVMRNVMLNAWNVSASPGSKLTATFAFLGRDTHKATTTVTDVYDSEPTDVAKLTTKVMNAASNVGRIGRGISPIGESDNYVLSLGMNVSNGLYEVKGVGHLGAVDIGTGTFSVSGTMSTSFDSGTLSALLRDQVVTSYDMALVAPDKHAMVMDLPSIKFSSGVSGIPGRDQRTVLPLNYQAIEDASLNWTMLVSRIPFAR